MHRDSLDISMGLNNAVRYVKQKMSKRTLEFLCCRAKILLAVSGNNIIKLRWECPKPGKTRKKIGFWNMHAVHVYLHTIPESAALTGYGYINNGCFE